MSRRAGWNVLLFVIALTGSNAARAQDSALDTLIRQVEQSTGEAAKINTQREQAFVNARDKQAALLSAAEAELAQARGLVTATKNRYESSQKANLALRAQLQERSADYLQVYAASKDVSGALLGAIGDSYRAAQHPPALETLRRLATQSEVPTAADLEALWLVLLHDINDNGKADRFIAPVAFADGQIREAEVQRIGSFSAISEGRYLVVENGRFTEPQSQPARRFRRAAAGYAESKQDFAEVMIDPSSGKLLLLDAARPRMLERIEQGGLIGYLIIAIGAMAAALGAYQALFLMRTQSAIRRQLQTTSQADGSNPLGRVLMALGATSGSPRNPDENANDADVLELRLFEAVSREKPKLIRFQSFIRLVVAAGPLLGLVGTVTGMIVTFQVITEIGAGDPKAMAQGISQAMIATLLGLGIAIPLLFINAYLASRSRELLQVLDEQAAGLLARTLDTGGTGRENVG